jgi:hypothetical protein
MGAALSVALSIPLMLIPSAAIAQYKSAVAINFFWSSSGGSPSGTWLTRELEVTQTGDASYFSIIGNWTPPFYIGVQELSYRTGKTEHVALFSAWDTYPDNYCMTCSPESRGTKEYLTKIKELGDGVKPGVFGYEGTGVNAFMNDFNWQVGDRIRAVINLRPLTSSTEISAALQLNDGPWRYFGTYIFAKRFETLEPGYSFIEDFGGRPNTIRSAEYRNSWMESESLDRITHLDSVGAQRNLVDSSINPGHVIKQRSSSGLWAEIGNTVSPAPQVWTQVSMTRPEDMFIPLQARLAALNLSGEAAERYADSYSKLVGAVRLAADRAKLDKLAFPSIRGAARIGSPLTLGAESQSGVAQSVQWYADDAPILGATESSFIPGRQHFGSVIHAEVTYAAGSASRKFRVGQSLVVRTSGATWLSQVKISGFRPSKSQLTSTQVGKISALLKGVTLEVIAECTGYFKTPAQKSAALQRAKAACLEIYNRDPLFKTTSKAVRSMNVSNQDAVTVTLK